MEWGLWMGRWSVGKHLASKFCKILWETLGFWGDFFDEFLKVSSKGIDLGDRLAKFSVEGFVFFYLFRHDVDEVVCPFG